MIVRIYVARSNGIYKKMIIFVPKITEMYGRKIF